MAFLTADNLSKSYGDTVALDEFSLSVEPAEIFALVGPDGAGKTTMIRILCGLLTADKGRVTIDGKDLEKQFETIKPDLGYMPQQFSLYPDLSVEENLTFYGGLYGLTGKAYRNKRDRLYEFSNLGPFARRRAGALSGGMKQKLALSCALIHDPRLLILDEPTTGVDPLSRRQFWETLQELKSDGVTILVSTPYMDEVSRCDRAAFILDGRKLSEDTPDNLAAAFEGDIYYLDHAPESSLIDAVNRVDGYSAARFGAGLHLYVKPGHKIDGLRSQLRDLGVTDGQISATEPNLEDRFIQLMGGD